jgi:hypothetical protein
MYTLQEDGLVQVENNGLTGLFSWDGRHQSGDLTYADVHMLVWLAGPQLPEGADLARRHRG